MKQGIVGEAIVQKKMPTAATLKESERMKILEAMLFVLIFLVINRFIKADEHINTR